MTRNYTVFNMVNETTTRATKGYAMAYNVRCTACKEEMSRDDWNVHDCPMTPKPRTGESFEAFTKRAEQFRKDRR